MTMRDPETRIRSGHEVLGACRLRRLGPDPALRPGSRGGRGGAGAGSRPSLQSSHWSVAVEVGWRLMKAFGTGDAGHKRRGRAHAPGIFDLFDLRIVG